MGKQLYGVEVLRGIGNTLHRITATVPWGVLKRLQERADHEGRSLSSLVSQLLEVAIS